MSHRDMRDATWNSQSSGKTGFAGGGDNNGCSVAFSTPVASGNFSNGTSWSANVGGGYAGSYSGNGSYGASAGFSMKIW